MPAPDCGDDFVWIGGPGEALRLLIVLFEEAVDRGLQVADGAKDAATDEELRSVWRATAGPGSFNAIVRMLTLTASGGMK